MRIRRIKLLSKSEIDDLYELPIFTSSERKYFFYFTKSEQKLIKLFSTNKTKIFFMLQLGYLKRKQQFFVFDLKDVQNDAQYLHNKFFIPSEVNKIESSGNINRETLSKQKAMILDCLKYKNCDGEEVEQKLAQIIKKYPKPRNAIAELIKYCGKKKIVLPQYRYLQDLYTQTSSREITRIDNIIKNMKLVNQEKIARIISIKCEKEFVTLQDLRQDQSNFSTTEMRKYAMNLNNIELLFIESENIIPRLELSTNAIRYYASIIEQYSPARIRLMNKTYRTLCALCFINNRYRVFANNMISGIIFQDQKLRDKVSNIVDKQLTTHAKKMENKRPQVAKFLKWFPEQEQAKITCTVLYKKAYEIMPKEDFGKFASYISGTDVFDQKQAKWDLYEAKNKCVAINLRPIFNLLDFKHCDDEHFIILALNAVKDHLKLRKRPKLITLTKDLYCSLPKSMLKYLKNIECKKYEFCPKRFEFYVYSKISSYLKDGYVYCDNSMLYRNLDDDLLPKMTLQEYKSLAQDHGYENILKIVESDLDESCRELDSCLNILDYVIENPENNGMTVVKDKNGNYNWKLCYANNEDKESSSFFSAVEKSDIVDIINFVGNTTGAFDTFEHKLGKKIKKKEASQSELIACILSEAFSAGLQNISSMSDISFNTLRGTSSNFIRYETLENANDLLGDYLYSLLIFKAWNLLDNKLVADIDGQKASTRNKTLQTRYSKKYFGNGKGISVLSLIANFFAVNVKNIGLNEYEGNHLCDMVYSSKSEVPIDYVTGDNHSINQLNHLILKFIDVEFIPNIKNIHKASENIYSFNKTPKKNDIIKPKRKIDIDLIKSNKQDILRVLLSLLLQENSQYVIIKKINSDKRHAKLKSALSEYNNILSSIHILNTICTPTLRKAMKVARNRTKSYRSMQQVTRKLYNGAFTGKRIFNHNITTQAIRFVSNCIVIYNAIILNRLYEQLVNSGASKAIIEKFLRISPMAWTHINLTGRYKFKNKITICIEAAIQILIEELKKRKMA